MGEIFQVHSEFFQNPDSSLGLLCSFGKYLIGMMAQEAEAPVAMVRVFLCLFPACPPSTKRHYLYTDTQNPWAWCEHLATCSVSILCEDRLPSQSQTKQLSFET